MTRSSTEIFRVFGRIGLLSFGGPAAQISLMHKELVEDRPWLTEAQFLRATSFCMLLPGPEAMQLATYAGWRVSGITGGLLAGGLFVLPGAIVIVALAMAYGAFGGLPWVQAIFLGVQAAVVVIVVQALRKIAARALTSRRARAIALAAFLALFVLGAPFPAVILAAAGLGAFGRDASGEHARPLSGHKPVRILVIGGLIWAAPILLALAFGATFLTQVGLFFSQLAVVSFGGAYSVLAYMTQAVVGDFGWLTTDQMLDALGLAETTPGPLILVTQFVAMVAGLAEGGLTTALLAGAMTLWVTFVPCFIWIFAGAPVIDWLDGQPRLQGALAGITAAVVGVIASLALLFAVNVVFRVVEDGPLALPAPVLMSLDPVALGLTLFAAALMLGRGWGLLLTLAVTAAAAGIVFGLRGI